MSGIYFVGYGYDPISMMEEIIFDMEKNIRPTIERQCRKLGISTEEYKALRNTNLLIISQGSKNCS